MEVKFDWVEPVYTGGGIYIFLGKISGGEWFYACDAWYDVRLLDANPSEKDDEYEFRGDNPSWQETHMVKDIECKDELLPFWKAMYAWVLANKPHGNYTMDDMTQDFNSCEENIMNL